MDPKEVLIQIALAKAYDDEYKFEECTRCLLNAMTEIAKLVNTEKERKKVYEVLRLSQNER